MKRRFVLGCEVVAAGLIVAVALLGVIWLFLKLAISIKAILWGVE